MVKYSDSGVFPPCTKMAMVSNEDVWVNSNYNDLTHTKKTVALRHPPDASVVRPRSPHTPTVRPSAASRRRRDDRGGGPRAPAPTVGRERAPIAPRRASPGASRARPARPPRRRGRRMERGGLERGLHRGPVRGRDVRGAR